MGGYNISFSKQEWLHLLSVIQLDSMSGDKQSILLWEKLKEIDEKIEKDR